MSHGARRGGAPGPVTLEQLDRDPHPVHHALRDRTPVAWVPALGGWLVTSHALATAAMRDAGTFTVDDPRFSTARVIGPSMLSLDGPAHARHRAPFLAPFRAAAVGERFAPTATGLARELLADLRPAGRGELRRGFAGPMAAAIVARALGMDDGEAPAVLADYDAIVESVSGISAGEAPTSEGAAAFADLRERLAVVIDGRSGDSLLAAAAGRGDAGSGEGSAAAPAADITRDNPRESRRAAPALDRDEIVSNAAVLLFGGIETTEGMIANAAALILAHPGETARLAADPAGLDAAIDESLRLEPAAAVIDRYATRDTMLGAAAIARGELVRISIAGANRDPAVFPDPDRYDPGRANIRRHLAFAQGPHVCVGVHLARLEARAALNELLTLPGVRLDPERPPQTRGLVFRKPVRLDALWDRSAAVSRRP